MLLRRDGSVWSTAVTLHGDLGPSRGVGKFFEQVIPNGAMAMGAGTGYSLVIKEDDSVWAIGRNARGQLGDGTRKAKERFSFVTMIPRAKAVATGSGHSMVLTEDGNIWVTGWNKHGQLGDKRR